MSSNNYMTNAEKLTAFLDGELDAAEAESLFFDMASNPELQEAMRQQIIISKSLKNALILPPVALKESLFANLGLDGAAAAPIAVSFFSLMLNSKAIMILSSAMIAIFATIFFMLNYLSDSAKPIAMASNAKSSSSIAAPIPNNIPITSSFESEAKIESKRRPPSHFATKPNGSSKANGSALASAKNETASESLLEQPLASNQFQEEPYYYNIEQSQYHSNSAVRAKTANSLKFMRWLESNPEITEFLSNISMQFRFAESAQLTNINVKPVNNPLLNNFAFAIYYDLGKNHSIGVEIGQENFLQKFNGYENSIPVEWLQNYIAFWAGGTYRYSMNEYALLQPYSSIMVGGTRIGPIAKITLGGKYNLTSKISAFAGWENTGLFYQFQNNWFSSFKSGLTAGIAVKF